MQVKYEDLSDNEKKEYDSFKSESEKRNYLDKKSTQKNIEYTSETPDKKPNALEEMTSTKPVDAVDPNSRYVKIGDKWVTEEQHKHWIGITDPRRQQEYLNSIKGVSPKEAQAKNKKTPQEKPTNIGTVEKGKEYTDEQLHELNKEADKAQAKEDKSFNRATDMNVNNTSGYMNLSEDVPELNLTAEQYHADDGPSLMTVLKSAEKEKWSVERTKKYLDSLYPDGWSSLAEKIWSNSSFGKKEQASKSKDETVTSTTPSSEENVSAVPTSTSTPTTPKIDPTPKYKGNSNLEFLDEERAKLSNMTTEQIEETEKLMHKYDDIAEKIDPHYIENMPRWILQAFTHDKFGKHKIDPELEKQYNKIKNKKNPTPEEQKIIKEYKAQDEEKKMAQGTLGYFLVDKIATGLANASAVALGQQPNQKALYDDVVGSHLGGALERYNKKYEDMANNDMSLIYNDALASQEINNQLKKVYADKTVQPYLQRLDLDNRSKFVNYVAAMGDKLPWEQLPDLLKGLLVYQDTGNLPQTAFNMLEKAGNFLTNLLPWK